MFQNKPLLPYEEWNIDFSELTVGTRVGIGFFGEVFRGIWNGTDVAIKVFLEQDLTAENMEDFCNEISILRYVYRLSLFYSKLAITSLLVF
jgi:serine/threonine protein kinase